MHSREEKVFGFVRRSPTTLHVVPTVAEAHEFPSAAIDALRPSRHRILTGVILGMVLAWCVAIFVAPSLVNSEWEALRGWMVIISCVPLFFLYAQGHPSGFLIGASGGVTVGVAAGGSVWSAIIAAAVLLLLFWANAAGYRARENWWPRIAALSGEHVMVQAVLEGLWEFSSYPRSRSDIRVVATGVPYVWTLRVTSSPDYAPREGDTVTVWYRPVDPEAAVLCVTTTRGAAAK